LQNYVGALEDAISDQLPSSRLVLDTRKLTTGTQLEQAQAFQLLTGGRSVMAVDEARDLLGLPPVESGADNNAREIAEIIQKVYLGVVNGILTVDEARTLVNRAGAGLERA
jgi:hypothetical protein